jgi:hypothetical protein
VLLLIEVPFPSDTVLATLPLDYADVKRVQVTAKSNVATANANFYTLSYPGSSPDRQVKAHSLHSRKLTD